MNWLARKLEIPHNCGLSKFWKFQINGWKFEFMEIKIIRSNITIIYISKNHFPIHYFPICFPHQKIADGEDQARFRSQTARFLSRIHPKSPLLGGKGEGEGGTGRWQWQWFTRGTGGLLLGTKFSVALSVCTERFCNPIFSSLRW